SGEARHVVLGFLCRVERFVLHRALLVTSTHAQPIRYGQRKTVLSWRKLTNGSSESDLIPSFSAPIPSGGRRRRCFGPSSSCSATQRSRAPSDIWGLESLTRSRQRRSL